MNIETILTRRSIRDFQNEAISDESEHQLLKAAMAAPSAGNQQPWHFIMVHSSDLKDRLAEAHPYAKMASKAPLVIVVCGDPDNGIYPEFWVQDCSAATQNILLAAHSMELGAVWTGIYPEEDRCSKIRDILNIPQNIVPFALIPVGYPAEAKKPVVRYKRDRIHGDDKW